MVSEQLRELVVNNYAIIEIVWGKRMQDATVDLIAKVGIDANDIEALAAYYEVTCDYYMEEFLWLEDLIDDN